MNWKKVYLALGFFSRENRKTFLRGPEMETLEGSPLYNNFPSIPQQPCHLVAGSLITYSQ